jgi:hypothetical protein
LPEGTKYEDRDDYEWTGDGEERRAAIGRSDGSFAEALVRAAEEARRVGAEPGHRFIVSDIAVEIGNNPPISQYRVTVTQVAVS